MTRPTACSTESAKPMRCSQTDEPTSARTIAWAKTYEAARVVYLQLGHDHRRTRTRTTAVWWPTPSVGSPNAIDAYIVDGQSRRRGNTGQ